MSAPLRLQNLRASALDVNSSIAALFVHSVDTAGAYVSPGAGSTQISVKEILSSSGGTLIDSTNVSLGVTIRAGSAGGTEYIDGDVDLTPNGGLVFFDNGTNTMRVVTSSRGLPVNVLAGSVSSLAGQVSVGEYSTTAPAVGSTGLVVRVASTGVRVINSSAADLNVTVAGYSTTANVSSLAGNVTVSPVAGSTFATRPLQSSAADLQMTATPAAGSTWSVRPLQSSAADLQVTATPAAGSTFNVRPLQSSAADLQMTATPVAGSTWNVRPLQSSAADLQVTARLNTSSGGAVEGSTTTQSTGSVLGLNVRDVMPSGRQSTTTLITSTHSTALYSLVSSAASLKQCVTAYFVGSTHTNPSTLIFMSSNVIDRWHVNFGSGSSGITGANMSVNAPDWIFQTDVANALNLRIEGGSSITATVVARVSIKWFSEA